MPDRYEAIRDSIFKRNKAKGMSDHAALREAKTSAAKIYNSHLLEGEKPVTGPERGDKPASVKDVRADIRRRKKKHKRVHPSAGGLGQQRKKLPPADPDASDEAAEGGAPDEGLE